MSGFAEKTDIQKSFKQTFEKFARRLNGNGKSMVHQIRKNAIEVFEKTGFPGLKDEEYKYTHLGKALEKEFNFSYEFGPVSFDQIQFENYRLKGMDAYEAVFIDGGYAKQLSSLQFAPGVKVMDLEDAYAYFPADFADHFSSYAKVDFDSFVALNTAFSRHGAFIKVDDRTIVDKPIVIYHITTETGNVISYPRNLVLVGREAQATVIEMFYSPSGIKTFVNEVSEISVSENAGLEYYKMQTDLEDNYHVGTTVIHQKRDSRVNTYTVSINGIMVRNNLTLVLDGENCESHMYGLYLLHGKTHVDNHTLVDHRKPNCFSNELYKGVLHDSSTGVFNGKIYVQADAQKTNAFQSNKNIVLNNSASINTKPQLEIWADDVKCSHGCTVGQLDYEQIFYLRSRGMSEDSAKAMLLIAFANDFLETMKIDSLRKAVQDKILNRLHEDFIFD